MRYKDNWEMSRKRLEAFWDQEIIDRCCVNVVVNGAEVDELPIDDKEKISYWTDPERIIRRNRSFMESAYYGGDAFPNINLNLGASGHAGFFEGAKHYFGESVWFFPSLNVGDELKFDENSFLFRKTLELAKAFAEDSKGDYIVCMPDSTGDMDALSHLMGPDELLPAMLEDPEWVLAARKKIDQSYERIMKDVYQIVKGVNQGGSGIGWLRTWAPGFHAQLQCDMSVMISNDMFEEFVMPEMRAQCDLLEYPLYHFDGVEQIRHLDSLLSIPKLRAIQWTQVVGQNPCTDYFPVLKRIQEAGKSLVIHVTPEQIRPIMENLSSKGLYLLVSANSRDEADEIVKSVEKWTHE